MNKWLAELHRLQGRPEPAPPSISKTQSHRQLTKPTQPGHEGGFEGFVGCRCEGVSEFSPLAAMHYAHDLLRDHRPKLIEESRWQQAVVDGETFLRVWGGQAAALGWTETNLFGLHRIPKNPPASYRRLSRYDQAGLIWLLQGRAVVALTECSAAIQNPTGTITNYRKPATTQVA